MKKTGVEAGQVYVDPSALSRLYLHQQGSRAMAAWRHKTPGSLLVTHHGRTEITNAIALAIFRQHLSQREGEEAWSWLEEDFAHGHLHQADLLWRATLNRAGELSRLYSPTLGTRTLDVMHVASALELGLPWFLTFDERQQLLARKAGLKIVRLPRN